MQFGMADESNRYSDESNEKLDKANNMAISLTKLFVKKLGLKMDAFIFY